jgi:membrane glycosyltransferase
MIKNMKEHEQYMEEIVWNQPQMDLNELRDTHWVQIGFLQHERLVHLMVTLAITILMILSFVVTWFLPVVLMLLLDVLLTVLEVAYIVYYYKLENMVQRWYLLYGEICRMIREEKEE